MTSMIRRILVTALAGVTLLLSADPTGTWTGDQPGRDGNTYNITFNLPGVKDSHEFKRELSSIQVNRMLMERLIAAKRDM